MKKSDKKFRVVMISLAILILVVMTACNKEIDNDTIELTSNTTEVSTEIISTEENSNDTVKKGIIQPTENSEDYFSEKVEIMTFVEPDANGHYVVEESQWTLDVNRKTLEEEVELRKEEMAKFEVEVIETSTAADGSASFVFDEENYNKMITVVENVTNDRVGLYGECVSISKDLDEVIIYADENTQSIDFYSSLSFLSWHIFQCQAYSGVKANDIKILVKVAHIDTEEVLMELTLDMNISFNMSDEEWNALFDKYR